MSAKERRSHYIRSGQAVYDEICQVSGLAEHRGVWWYYISRMEAGQKDFAEAVLGYERDHIKAGIRSRPTKESDTETILGSRKFRVEARGRLVEWQLYTSLRPSIARIQWSSMASCVA